MHKILALYSRPNDPEHFRTYYRDTHFPIASKLPGLQSYLYTWEPEALGGDSPYFCIAELEFDDAGAFEAALNSPEGRATVADVQNFATGGVTIFHYDLNA